MPFSSLEWDRLWAFFNKRHFYLDPLARLDVSHLQREPCVAVSCTEHALSELALRDNKTEVVCRERESSLLRTYWSKST